MPVITYNKRNGIEDTEVKLFDVPKKVSSEYENFVWKTEDGRLIPIREMRLDHMFNIIKYIYNPVALQLGLETVMMSRHSAGRIRHLQKNAVYFIPHIRAMLDEFLRRNVIKLYMVKPLGIILSNIDILIKYNQTHKLQ